MKIAILGTGQFALSIGYLLDRNDNEFTFIGRDEIQLDELLKKGTNSHYSTCKFKNKPKIQLLNGTFNYDIIFYCLPSSCLNIVQNLKNVIIVFTCKGFYDDFIYNKFENYCILAGGSYAIEIFKNIPCYMTLSSLKKENNIIINKLINSKYCIISNNNQPKSIELLGIFKNILAIFCGIINELNMGKNIEAAFISIVLKNIKDIMELDERTLIEPSGIGDLFLSCSSIKSRNYSFGISLIQNKTDKFDKLVEGYQSLYNMKKYKNNNIINNLSNIIEVILERESNENIKDKILKIIFPHH
jgi:glycerol-3-phosphate dehydrogenase (NAD(P)+)